MTISKSAEADAMPRNGITISSRQAACGAFMPKSMYHDARRSHHIEVISKPPACALISQLDSTGSISRRRCSAKAADRRSRADGMLNAYGSPRTCRHRRRAQYIAIRPRSALMGHGRPTSILDICRADKPIDYFLLITRVAGEGTGAFRHLFELCFLFTP